MKCIIATITLLVILLPLPSDAQTCGAYVGGYIPSWRDPGTVDYTKLSHVFYAFARTNSTGEIVVDSPPVFEQFKTAATGKQRYVSLGGAGDATLASMAGNPTVRQQFVTNAVAFCQLHSLQGLDMDWEGILTVQDSTHFGELVRALASSFHTHGLQLTITIGYGDYGGGYYNVGALKTADWIQLMVYDQTGTWADSPYGNHATYQHVLDAVSYWTARGYSDLSRIVIGVPFYGYRFNSTNGGLATGMSYAEIMGAHPGLSCDWDNVDLIEFNGPETIRRKVRYVIDHGLKGVMIWEMGQDLSSSNDRSLLKAISLAACDQPRACDTFITTAVENMIEEPIGIYPNPVHEFLTITRNRPGVEAYYIELYNVLGQRVLVKETSFVAGNERVDLAGVSEGIYLVNVRRGSNSVGRGRVMKVE